MNQTQTIRPTKKQKELLEFIADFIGQHGYSPSYREIKNGKGYNSVATVALHINNLIKRGHLRKRDNSARSLEVIGVTEGKASEVYEVTAAEEKWLIEKIDLFFEKAEQADMPAQTDIDSLYVLVGTLKVLKLVEAVNSFLPRLAAINNKVK